MKHALAAILITSAVAAYAGDTPEDYKNSTRDTTDRSYSGKSGGKERRERTQETDRSYEAARDRKRKIK